MLTEYLLHAKYCFISYSFQLLFNNHHLEKHCKFLLCSLEIPSIIIQENSKAKFLKLHSPQMISSSHNQTLKSPTGHGPIYLSKYLYPLWNQTKPTTHTVSNVWKWKEEDVYSLCYWLHLCIDHSLSTLLLQCRTFLTNIKFGNTYPKGTIIWYCNWTHIRRSCCCYNHYKNENFSALRGKSE